MQQRRLRLGDILDDYCPRERRVTNHAVVAMVEQDVKQTRCTTCDAEHEYREARVPALRRRKDPGALSGGLPADALRARRTAALADDDLAAGGTAIPADTLRDLPADALSDDTFPDEPLLDTDRAADDALVAAALEALHRLDDEDQAEPVRAAGDDDGPVHRRLIRATLPRTENQPTEWKEPDFTVRQPGARGREADGNRPGHRPGGGGGGRGRRPQQQQQQRWHGGSSRFADGAPQGQRGHGGGHGARGRSGPSQGQPGQRQPGQRQSSGRPAGQNQPHGRKRGR